MYRSFASAAALLSLLPNTDRYRVLARAAMPRLTHLQLKSVSLPLVSLNTRVHTALAVYQYPHHSQQEKVKIFPLNGKS